MHSVQTRISCTASLYTHELTSSTLLKPPTPRVQMMLKSASDTLEKKCASACSLQRTEKDTRGKRKKRNESFRARDIQHVEDRGHSWVMSQVSVTLKLTFTGKCLSKIWYMFVFTSVLWSFNGRADTSQPNFFYFFVCLFDRDSTRQGI